MRLYYRVNGAWNYVDCTYTEFGSPTPPSLNSPAPGSTLTGSSQQFVWNPGAGATAFELYVGTTHPSSFDIYKGVSQTGNSVTVPSIPTNGAPLYVRLYYKVNGAWSYIDYTYTEFGP